jgi:hypothetical protein
LKPGVSGFFQNNHDMKWNLNKPESRIFGFGNKQNSFIEMDPSPSDLMFDKKNTDNNGEFMQLSKLRSFRHNPSLAFQQSPFTHNMSIVPPLMQITENSQPEMLKNST